MRQLRRRCRTAPANAFNRYAEPGPSSAGPIRAKSSARRGRGRGRGKGPQQPTREVTPPPLPPPQPPTETTL